MNRSLHLAIKDLTQIFRYRMVILFTFLMPLVFTVMMGFAFTQTAAASVRLPVGVVFLDQGYGGSLRASLTGYLMDNPELNLILEGGEEIFEEAKEDLNTRTLAAVLVIPPGFGEALLGGGELPLQVIADESRDDGLAAVQAIRSQVLRFRSGVHAALLANKLMTGDITVRDQIFVDTLLAIREAYQNPPLLLAEEGESAKSFEDQARANPFTQTSPGILVQFTIMSMIGTGTILVEERKNGTLNRLLTTSINRAEVIAGHMLAMFVLVFIQQFLLILFGQLVLGVAYFREPVGMLLVMAGMSLWITSLGLLIGVVARSDDQVVLFSLVAMFVFTPLAGAWFPLEGTGPAFATLSRFTPAAWAMIGYQNLIVRGLGLDSAVLPALILTGFAALFVLAALWRFRRQQG